MALIYNPTPYKVQVKAMGNYFDFAPKQKKSMNDDIARFIAIDKKESGLVALPEICLDAPESEEAKQAMAELSRTGIINMLNYYKSVVHNLTVSLRRDLDMHNDKTDVAALATDGEIHALKVVKELSDILNSESAVKEEEAKKLISELLTTTNK